MTNQFMLLLRYKKLVRDIRAIEEKLLELFAHPLVSDDSILEWREKYRKLRALHHEVICALERKGIRV